MWDEGRAAVIPSMAETRKPATHGPVLKAMTVAALAAGLLGFISCTVRPSWRLYSAVGGPEACYFDVSLRDFAIRYEHPGQHADHSAGFLMVSRKIEKLARAVPFVLTAEMISFASSHWSFSASLPLWMPLALLGAYPLFVLWRDGRTARQRRERGLCEKCGYDLTGNVSGVCSECGAKVGS